MSLPFHLWHHKWGCASRFFNFSSSKISSSKSLPFRGSQKVNVFFFSFDSIPSPACSRWDMSNFWLKNIQKYFNSCYSVTNYFFRLFFSYNYFKNWSSSVRKMSNLLAIHSKSEWCGGDGFFKNPYKIPKFGGKSKIFGGKSNYIQKIGGDNIPSIPRF